jgi:hypothetical protein
MAGVTLFIFFGGVAPCPVILGSVLYNICMKDGKDKSRSYILWVGAVFTLLIIGFTLVVWREEKSGGACYEQHNSRNAEDRRPLSVDGLEKKQESPRQTDSPASNSESYFCNLIAPANLPNIYLALIGMGGVFVAIFTLKSIHHQAIQARKQTHILKNSAETAEKSADAAYLNAQAVINSERPWLLIQRDEHKDSITKPNFFPLEETMSGQQRATYCHVFIRNYGKTPAKVIAEVLELQIGENRSEPPDPGVFSKPKRIDNDIFPPEETLAGEAWLTPQGIIKLSDRDAILTHKNKFLWLCGLIRYRDTFERENAPEHETRFCFVYETWTNAPEPRWTPAGPKEYNKAT